MPVTMDSGMQCTRRGTWFSLLILFTMALAQGVVAHPKVLEGAPPSWVQPLPLPPQESLEPSGQNVQGMLLDRQVHAESGEGYYHAAYRINTAAGVQSFSHLELPFSPEYQTMTLHAVRLHRAGKVIHKLQLSKVEVLQQEKDLERFQYNGQLTALILLDDVRVGDIVEYSFTRTGRNPVFGERFDELGTVAWGTSLERYRFRLLSTPARALVHRIHAEKEALSHSTRLLPEGVREDCWSAGPQKALSYEEGAPGWHLFLPMLQVTDFRSWSDVVAWALPLYTEQKVDPAVAAKAASLCAKLNTPQEKTLALLDFVQQEIRYMGIELGPGSHAPQAPAVVLERRYGDCKDKTRLLCSMLASQGIPAAPALTHSTLGAVTPDFLPSPYAFDHVITRVTINGLFHWVDPTLSNQKGTLHTRYLPNYQHALAIQAGTTGLNRITPREEAMTRLCIDEQFEIPQVGGVAALTVTTSYRGALADSMRSYLQQTPAETVAKNSLNFTLKRFPEATRTAPQTWTDDPSENEVRVTSHYSVPKLWQSEKGSPVLKAEFYPSSLRDFVTPPEQQVRNSPLSVPYRYEVVQKTRLHLPSAWPITPERQLVEDPAFEGEATVTAKGDTVDLVYRYTTKDDHVTPERMAEYTAKLAEFNNCLGYHFTHNTEIAARNAHFRLNYPLVGVLIGSLALWGLASWWLNRQNWGLWPVRADASFSALHGLGGWLVLVAIGLFLRPVIQVVEIVKSLIPLLDARTWEANTTAVQCLVSMEVLMQVGILVMGVHLIMLFFQKRRLFPWLFVVQFAFLGVYLVGDGIASVMLLEEADKNLRGLGVSLGQYAVPAAIWISYMFVSKRAMATFTRESRPVPPPVPQLPLQPAAADEVKRDTDTCAMGL